MSLSISISNDDGNPFLPGSVVLGVVKLVTYNDQNIGDLTINFSGRTRVLITHSYGDITISKCNSKSVGYLFSQQLTLYRGEYTHRKGSYMWPFAFHIPLSACPRVLPSGGKDYFCPQTPWKSDFRLDYHPLPPSMNYSSTFVCSVDYILCATLSPSCQIITPLAKSLSAVKHVRIQALANRDGLDIGRDSASARYRHNILFPLDNLPQTIFRKFCSTLCAGRWHFRNRIAPELHISVLMPKRIILKEEAAFSVIVRANYQPIKEDKSTENAPAEGPIYPMNVKIKSFKLSLMQHIEVRAGCHRSSSEKTIFTRKGSCASLSAESSLQSEPAECPNHGSKQTVSVNLADITDLSIPIAGLLPDFSTYNIACCHFLKMWFKMEFRNKSFKFHLGKIVFQVLPPEYDTGQRIDMRPRDGSASQYSLDDLWVVAPPPGCGLAEDNDINALSAEPPPPYT